MRPDASKFKRPDNSIIITIPTVALQAILLHFITSMVLFAFLDPCFVKRRRRSNPEAAVLLNPKNS